MTAPATRTAPATMRAAVLSAPNEEMEERRVGKECRYRWSPYH